eukprot:gene4505-6167_t
MIAQRHCATCLKISNVSFVCSQCKKRTYCSKTCQKADWHKQGFQSHKKWCAVDCGEEDRDWEVTSCGEKGVGIKALRHFKALDRIMVDGIRNMNDPVILDLEPREGLLMQKFALNRRPITDPGSGVLCARISRVNHSCHPNSCHRYDEFSNVLILLAERDISPGEEITICYTNLFDVASAEERSPEWSR